MKAKIASVLVILATLVSAPSFAKSESAEQVKPNSLKPGHIRI